MTLGRALKPALTAALIAVALVALTSAARTDLAPGAEATIPPSPTAWVTDNAGLLTSATRDSLNTELKQYEQTTGHHVLVWIGETTGAAPLEDWTIRAFTAWKVGRKGFDDGLVLFIFTRDHKIRIEVGYGLESVVTDAVASRIEREYIVPKMRAGDGDGAVTAGVNAILATIGGQPLPQTEQPSGKAARNNGFFWGLFDIFIVFFVLMVVFLARRSPAGAGWLAYTIGSGLGGYSGGGWSGGDSGGDSGGGYSGGGGMGGGGGASASW